MGDMRIMLVDDNGDLRRGMRDYLARQEGMKVVAAAGESAADYRRIGAGARRFHHARSAAGRTVLHGQAV